MYMRFFYSRVNRFAGKPSMLGTHKKQGKFSVNKLDARKNATAS